MTTLVDSCERAFDESLSRRRIARNVVWSWAGTISQMLCGFFVAPFLVRYLGQREYGLWVLTASFCGYLGLLDLGVRGAVGRTLSFYRAQNDQSAVNRVLSTALLVLCAVGFLALLATFFSHMLFFALFAVPVEQVAAARIALMCVGGALALTIPLSVFDASLWSCQRFDILNRVDIGAAIVRSCLSLIVVHAGSGLPGLGLVTFSTAVLQGATKAALSFRADPLLRIGPAFLSLPLAKELYGYGIWCFLLGCTQLILPQIGPLLIGSTLAIKLVTPYSVAVRLLGYVTTAVVTATGVVTPIATKFHATANHPQLKKVLMEGGMHCATFSFFSTSAIILLSGPLLTLWMGDAVAAEARPVLIIAALGEVLPMSQRATQSLALAMGHHWFAACSSIVDLAVGVSLAWLLIEPFGLTGIAAGFAISATVCRGAVLPTYICKLFGTSVSLYASATLLPSLLTLVPPALCLCVLLYLHPVTSWLELTFYATMYACGFGVSGALNPLQSALFRSSFTAAYRAIRKA